MFKGKLVSSPIINSPSRGDPFEFMCDASGVAHDVVLGQWRDKTLHSIYCASKALNEAHKNYTVS